MEEKKAFVLVQINLYLIWDKITSQKFDLRDFMIFTSHNFLYVEDMEHPPERGASLQEFMVNGNETESVCYKCLLNGLAITRSLW